MTPPAIDRLRERLGEVSDLTKAATVLVWTTGEMLSLPFLSGWVGNRAGEKSIGGYMGLFSLSISIAFVLGPLAGTWVYQRFGGTPLWYGCGVLGLFLWAGFALLAARPARAEAAAPLPLQEG